MPDSELHTSTDIANRLLDEAAAKHREFERQFPVLSDRLRDVQFMSMTKDDQGNLQTTGGGMPLSEAAEDWEHYVRLALLREPHESTYR